MTDYLTIYQKKILLLKLQFCKHTLKISIKNTDKCIYHNFALSCCIELRASSQLQNRFVFWHAWLFILLLCICLRIRFASEFRNWNSITIPEMFYTTLKCAGSLALIFMNVFDPNYNWMWRFHLFVFDFIWSAML